MSTQVIYGGTTDQLSTGSTEYLAACGNRIAAASYYRSLSSVAGTGQNLRIKLPTAPGVGKSRTFTLGVNGNYTSKPTVTISGGDKEGVDTSGTATIAAGDRLTIKSEVSNTPAASYVWYCWELVPTTAGQTIISGNIETVLATSGTQYVPYFATGYGPHTLATYARLYFPIAGTITAHYVFLPTAPGVGNKDRIFRVRRNAVSQAALAVTISGGTSPTSGNATGASVAIVPGDYVDVQSAYEFDKLKPAPAASEGSWALCFEPDDPDMFLVGHCTNDPLPSGTTTEYAQLCTGGDALGVATWGAFLGQNTTTRAVHWKCMRAKLTALPSSGTYTIWLNAFGDGPTAQFASTGATEKHCEAEFSVAEYATPALLCGAVSVGVPPPTSELSICLAGQLVPIQQAPFAF